MSNPFGDPVAQNVDPIGPGLQRLSDVLNLQRGQQALQTGAYQQQTAAAQAQQAQQTASQRQAAARFFQNYDVASHVGPDGTLDLDQALTNPQLKATGDAYPEIAKSLIAMKNSQLDAKQKLATLDAGARQSFLQNVGGLAADPDVKQGNNQGVGKVLDAIDQFGQSGGPDAARVADVYKPVVQNLVQVGKAAELPQVLRNFQLQAQDASRQTEQTYGTPGNMDTGGTIQPGVQAPAAAGGGFTPSGPAVSKTIPPGAQVVRDLSGAQYLLDPRSNTLIPVGSGRQGTAGSGRQPFQQPSYPGQSQDIESYRNEVQNLRQEAQNAPLARNINAQILRLTQDARTGPGTDAWQHAIGAVGAPFGLSPTASYQEVGKFLEKNAIASMQAMGGPPSDSRLDAAAKANGSTSFSPEALRTVTKFNDATTTALEQYRQGIDQAVGMGQNVDYTKLPAFKAAWAKNFDVRIFALENAIRDGDTDEQRRILGALKPNERADLMRKRSALTALSNGQVPQ